VKQLHAFFTLIIGIIVAFTASWQISLVVLATFPANIIAGTIQMAAFVHQ
jgi:ABC-type multidrug transport system fused ATPase/permease subunit